MKNGVVKLYSIIFLLLFVLGASSCNKDEIPYKLDNGNYEIPFGEKAIIEDICLTFDKVIEESRCPEDVVCFWEGRAHIRVIASTGSEKDSLEFITFNSLNQDSFLMAEFSGFKIELIEVYPYPNSDNEVSDNDYSAEFRIE